MPAVAALSALATLAACGGPREGHGISTDPDGATGFMTANPGTPQAAATPASIGTDADGRPYGYGLLGQPLPEFSGPLAGGGEFTSEDLEKWTLIDVWGIWCGDCMADAPYVAALSNAIRQDPGLDFISIHTPPSAARAGEAFGRYGSVEAYFAEKGYFYPTLIDGDASLRERLQIAWTPSYILVSPAGIVEGFRTDLSVSGSEPVKDLLKDIAGVRASWTPPALDQSALSIGPDGAGNMHARSAFTLSAIQAAFPGLDIVSDRAMAEGEAYPVFQARNEAGETVFTFEPDWSRERVSALITRHPDVAGPDGERIGKTRLGMLENSQQAGGCQPGLEAYSQHLVCQSGAFVRIFELPRSHEGPADQAPPQARDAATLVEMRYLPPPAARE